MLHRHFEELKPQLNPSEQKAETQKTQKAAQPVAEKPQETETKPARKRTAKR